MEKESKGLVLSPVPTNPLRWTDYFWNKKKKKKATVDYGQAG